MIQASEDFYCSSAYVTGLSLDKTFVVLRGGNIGKTGIQFLRQLLEKNLTVEKVMLCRNDGDAGIKGLLEALSHNKTIKEIYLKNNNIGAQGVKKLAEFLKGNVILHKLDLRENKIGNINAKFLIQNSSTLLLKGLLLDRSYCKFLREEKQKRGEKRGDRAILEYTLSSELGGKFPNKVVNDIFQFLEMEARVDMYFETICDTDAY